MDISNKFEINIETSQLWFYKDRVKTECLNSGDGQYNNQKFFILDDDNKDHWINYAVKYSGGKVWVDWWYKKRVEDSSEPNGVRYINYKKRVDKLANIVEVEFNYLDEMVKITDMAYLKNDNEKQRGYKWMNKVKLDMAKNK